MVDALSVIVRTMPSRAAFLDDCLFILSNQDYSPIEVLVVVQIKPNEKDTTNQAITRWRPLFSALKVVTHEADSDARSRALNLGLKAATGSYIAFLDDDDKVYPHHYSRLISRIQETDAVWAFADTVQTLIDPFGRVRKRWMPYRRLRYSWLDLLAGNFIPIHAYVFDRRKVPDLLFDEQFSRLEDYDFLLRLAKGKRPIYIRRPGCAYCIRDDTTNSVSLHSDQSIILWEQMEKRVRMKNINRNLAFVLWINKIIRRYILGAVRNPGLAVRSVLRRSNALRRMHHFMRGIVNRTIRQESRRRSRY